MSVPSTTVPYTDTHLSHYKFFAGFRSLSFVPLLSALCFLSFVFFPLPSFMCFPSFVVSFVASCFGENVRGCFRNSFLTGFAYCFLHFVLKCFLCLHRTWTVQNKKHFVDGLPREWPNCPSSGKMIVIKTA